MIASPCKNCSKKNLPKSDCAKDCKLLKTIQNFEVEVHESGISIKQDYFTESEYDIPLSFEETIDLL